MQVESDIPTESTTTTLKDETPGEDFAAEKQMISGKAAAAAQILVEEEDDDSQESLSPTDFHNNDNKILALLNEDGSNYSFKGLMRKLNLHQQSLSRALHRLEEMELVEKSPVGYRLSKAGATAMSRIELLQQQHKPKGREYMQLLQTYIPLNIKASEVMRHLIGRWFKNLRWIGMIRSDTGYTLQWTSDDGAFQINLRLIADYIVIETNASTEKEKVQAMVGSYIIYEQITKVMQSRLDAYVLDHRGASAIN
ncbi:MAG TPA: MarR family transcriptional regulator [Nitrososphaera sp.]|jgi:DNA-binding HxlR family transcriptional regulator|nr:MarR family transcriptional regulator [Nitrososphaera sp.]